MAGSVDFSGAQATTERILEMLGERAQEALEGLAPVLAAHIAEKSPTPEEEYVELMGEGYEIPAFTGSGSADTDSEEPGRIRFVKNPSTFLQALAERAENRSLIDGKLMIGNLPFLLENSTFQFKDYVPTKRPKPGVAYDDSMQTVGPYFEAFEYGTAGFHVVPEREGYPLRPDTDPSHRPMEMTKPIEARFAYNPLDLEEISRSFLETELSKISS